MKYPSGAEIHRGDEVIFSDGSIGVVVIVIDCADYSSGFPSEEWSYLETGVMVLSQVAGLIHYAAEPVEFELVRRIES